MLFTSLDAAEEALLVEGEQMVLCFGVIEAAFVVNLVSLESSEEAQLGGHVKGQCS